MVIPKSDFKHVHCDEGRHETTPQGLLSDENGCLINRQGHLILDRK
jgi:hypothetical protein